MALYGVEVPKKTTDKILKDFELRLTRLEEAVFRKTTVSHGTSTKTDNFSGPSGGLRYLFSRGFFSEKRFLVDVRNALAKNGYHYSAQAAQTSLNRFSKPGGPLVTIKQDGKKVYVARK
jgi:hypothetical protein